VSLIGPSGCGKSTLLRVIGDLIQPTTGTVEVNGKPAGRARRDREYGMVFQAPVLFDWRTVEDNVKLPLELMGRSPKERSERAREMLELVELGDFLKHHPYQLSGGMQQRVAIARALAFEPAILLMDEPFGALDEMTRERMNSEVLRIWEATGTTIVFVTHSIPEAVFLSSRVVVMSARPGRITDVIDIDLPRPRGIATREEPRYFELVTAVREALRRGGAIDIIAEAEVGGGSPDRTAAEGGIG
jgi:NitT/TauT family transport system ATP-binding protein